jgi:3-deoxy-manno-octulosonate cytidylyltransferase (CMP-KDO synthetase)
MSVAIIIPARYASTRFPGKPLAEIAGRTMLQRVCELADNVSKEFEDTFYLVATDDERIAKHCDAINVSYVMTSEDCPTGSDRALMAALTLDEEPQFIVNLQGDAPFTPKIAVTSVIEKWQTNNNLDVITPIVQLNWEQLDRLRENKKTTPFSGTTCTIDKNGNALWFSKNIIPAIRKEDDLKKTSDKSPIYQHFGIYGYKTSTLKKFVDLPQSTYEKLEGLEQLRLIENGINIQTVCIDIDIEKLQSGIDSPEDLKRAEALLVSNQ